MVIILLLLCIFLVVVVAIVVVAVAVVVVAITKYLCNKIIKVMAKTIKNSCVIIYLKFLRLKTLTPNTQLKGVLKTKIFFIFDHVAYYKFLCSTHSSPQLCSHSVHTNALQKCRTQSPS